MSTHSTATTPLLTPQQSRANTFIIKRWVPLYEKEFLWDHTSELRHPGNSTAGTDLYGPRSRSPVREQPGEPGSRSRRRDSSAESAAAAAKRDSILRRRRASAEPVLPPPTSEAVTSRRSSSRTLREQNVRRKSFESAVGHGPAARDGGAGDNSDDSGARSERFRERRKREELDLRRRREERREKEQRERRRREESEEKERRKGEGQRLAMRMK